MKKFWQEFKDFAVQGNVMDLAVGVIIGGAFQGVVTSFTDNIISPVLGLFTGQNFNDLQVSLLGVTFTYGAFISTLINFIITAFIVFLMVKGMNRLRGKKPEETRDCPYCYTTISAKATRCPDCTSEVRPVAAKTK